MVGTGGNTMQAAKGPIRRNFIAGTVAALAGAFGLNVGRGIGVPVRAAMPDSTLTLYGRRRHQASNHPGLQSSHAVLSNARGGHQIGEAQTTRICGPFPVLVDTQSGTSDIPAAPSGMGSLMEFHSVRLDHGTLFGIGAARARHADRTTWAIVGGTGQFAGATGVCTETVLAGHGDDVELAITLSA
jgi:hypothetical protein